VIFTLPGPVHDASTGTSGTENLTSSAFAIFGVLLAASLVALGPAFAAFGD